MPVVDQAGRKIWQRRTRGESLARWAGWFGLVLLIAACWRFIHGQTVWEFVYDAPYQTMDLMQRSWPPDVAYLGALARPVWDTLNIATLGTLLAVVLAAPVAFLAARNTAPSRILRGAALLTIVSSRSINSLVWGLVLVAVFGPGVLAGILAIALRSIGFVAKLLYEAIEEIDPAPVEAIESTGARRLQVLGFGIVPQVLPAFAGISVFRWDINIREATVLGLVGAGGIGIQLEAAKDSLDWQRVAIILLLILGLVVISEAVSARLRKAAS
ncbi:phosphonate ABC transporter permease [Acidobacteria bacterium Mor1]|nr:phosphonate ABC transporter permease [Acidobacteria bacterium Mor1]